MEECTRAVGFATGDDSLAAAVERVNAEPTRLAAAGIAGEPEHVRHRLATGGSGSRYLGAFGYRLPGGAEAAS